MAIGLESDNTDLALIFDAYTSGRTKAATANIGTSSGLVDLSSQFENIIYGTAASATGIQSNGTDLNALYCKYGTSFKATLPSYPNQFNPPSETADTTVTVTGGPGGTYTYNWTYVSVSGTGGFSINSGQGTPTINWTLTSSYDGPSTFRLTCTVTATGGIQAQGSTTLRIKINPG